MCRAISWSGPTTGKCLLQADCILIADMYLCLGSRKLRLAAIGCFHSIRSVQSKSSEYCLDLATIGDYANILIFSI